MEEELENLVFQVILGIASAISFFSISLSLN